MLQLLQQRTKLSDQIGKMKRRHGAVIYVPERERELVARLTRLSKGKPPARAVAAVYREIMSSSRAAQGQHPIGVLEASASVVMSSSHACFGACDQFVTKKKWPELVKGFHQGKLSLALLTGSDLAAALQAPRWRSDFLKTLTVAGDFPPVPGTPLAERIFIITPRDKVGAAKADRLLILIECKSTVNAIKSLLHAMSDFSPQAEQLTRGGPAALVRLTLGKLADTARAMKTLEAASKSAGMTISILGLYPGTEDYGG